MAYLYDFWITDMNNNQVIKLDSGTSLKPGIVVGKTPRAIAVDVNGTDVWVANMTDTSVTKLVNGVVATNVTVGKVPMGIAIDSKSAVWVANYGSNTISKIVNGYKTLDIAVGSGPRGICVGRDNVVWVANFLSNTVSKIVDGIKVKDIPVGVNPYGICCDQDNNIWVSNSGSNTISKILNSEKVLDVAVGRSPYGICCDLNNVIYVANYIGDTVSKVIKGVKTIDIVVGDGPHGISVDKNNVLYVTNSATNTISKIVNDVKIGDITTCYNPISFGDATGMQSYIAYRLNISDTGGTVTKIGYSDLTPELQELISNAGGIDRINAVNVDYDDLTYPNVDLALDYLLYKAPVVTSFSNNVNIVENGATVNSVTLTWVLNKQMTVLSIDQGIGDVLGTTSKSLSSLNLKTDRTWTMTASDGKNTVTKSTSVLFQNKRYFGTSALLTLTDNDIIALGGEFATSRTQSKTLNASGGKFLYFVMPSSFNCDASKFKINGLFNSDWTKTTRTFMNASGYLTSYDIFRSTNLQTGASMTVDII